MAKLPQSFSIQSIRISSAIAEGRADDVIHELVDILRRGKADKATQIIAANWIETIGLKPGDAKALRSGKAAMPKEWVEVSEKVALFQHEGKTYETSVREAAEHFGYSERHVQKCVRMLNRMQSQSTAQDY